MSEYHNPVLLNESVDALVINRDGAYADATFGGGGHSRAILQKLSPAGRLIAFDRDSDALENELNDTRFKLIHNNFRFIHNYVLLERHQSGDPEFGLDGILADRSYLVQRYLTLWNCAYDPLCLSASDSLR